MGTLKDIEVLYRGDIYDMACLLLKIHDAKDKGTNRRSRHTMHGLATTYAMITDVSPDRIREIFKRHSVVHFGQITSDEGWQALTLAQKLGVRLVPPDDAQVTLAFDWTMQQERAAAYDSFYLALAKTLHSELWAADKRLVDVAGVSWIHLIPDAL
ncbi:MAG: type II toxin-antitoxin system VapC family toxin [Chloroflexota bacterium]|nr:type II toxin-antitoxin system VapC family toxin [Chloroflexota bacterium]